MFCIDTGIQSTLQIFLNRNIEQQQQVIEKIDTSDLSTINFDYVVKKIDELFANGILKCYTQWGTIGDPCVSPSEVSNMIDLYKNYLPENYFTMRKMLMFDSKMGLSKHAHSKENLYYEKLIFFNFLSMSRVKNSHLLKNWAAVTTIANFARGITHNKSSSQTYFGNAVHHKTMKKILDKHVELQETAIPELLSKENVVVATMDNNQKGFNVKHPRFGINSKFVKVTGRTFVKSVTTEIGDQEDIHCLLNYYPQVIPSVLGQPHFENIMKNGIVKIEDMAAAIKFPTDIQCTGMSVDITGNRVLGYIQIVEVSHIIVSERRFVSGYNLTEKNYKWWTHQKEIFKENSVRKDCMRIFSRLKRQILNSASTFQRQHTGLWNPKMGEASKLCIPAVSLYDEMKLEEYGMAIIELLCLCGILIKEKREVGGDKTLNSWKLGKNHESRVVYLCMDGLSLDHHRSLQKRLIDQPLSFTDSFAQGLIFQQDIRRIIEIPGPLHIAFHMCQCIFSIYTPLLKELQKILQWKKIKFQKVNESFRLCKSLLFLALEEADRLLWDIFLLKKKSDVEMAIVMYKGKEDQFACWLSRKYMSYIHEIIKISADERQKHLDSFIVSVRQFQMFWESIFCGDRIYQEYTMMKFLGVYLLLKKHQCVEITLSTIEREYHDISYKQLHDTRVNFHVQYKTDYSNADMVFNCFDLDEMQ